MESSSLISFPTINKIKSSENTPRAAVAISPGFFEKDSRSLAYNNLSSTKKQIEDLVITKLGDNNKKKPTKFRLLKENTSSSTKKLIETLQQRILEQELCINNLKSQFQPEKHIKSHKTSINQADFLTETISSLNKKMEQINHGDTEEFSRNVASRTKYKDKEILSLKQELNEYNSQFESVSHELLYLKDQNKQFLQKISLLKSKNLDLENDKKEFQEHLRKAENETSGTGILILFKQNEVEELSQMLQKSEESRRRAVEHSSYLEKELYLLKEKVQKLKEKNCYLSQEIQKIMEMYVKSDNTIEELKIQLVHFESKVSSEKSKASALKNENEKLQESLAKAEERFSSKLERLTQENMELQERKHLSVNSNRVPPMRCTSKRSGTEIESKFLSKLTSEEASRWQQRYFSIEQDLLSKKQQIEKMSRDELYLHTQIDTKNAIIQRLEDIIQISEPQSKNLKENTSLICEQVNEAYKILVVLDKMKGRLEDLLDSFKCNSCFKVKCYQFICSPCGHLYCDSCKETVDAICAACTEKCNFMAPVKLLAKVIERINEEREDLDALKNVASILTQETN